MPGVLPRGGGMFTHKGQGANAHADTRVSLFLHSRGGPMNPQGPRGAKGDPLHAYI